MQTPGLTNRREFLGYASGLMLIPALLQQCKPSTQTMQQPRIGLQLYTVRDLIAQDMKGTLARIADIGFEGVETAFWPEGVSPEDAASVLREVGLKVFAAHCEIPVGEKQSEVLRVAKAFDCKRIVWHGWPEDLRYKTAEGIKQLTGLYNDAAAFAKSNNLSFGIHNHWWEFHNKIGDRFAYEVLLDDLNKDVFFEIDTYWVKTAGHVPARIISDFGSRAPLLHIKDGPAPYNDNLADDTTPMVPVGKGSQDFPSIAKAGEGNIEWMIIEMDRVDGDPMAAIQQSYNYLVEHKLAKGGRSS